MTSCGGQRVPGCPGCTGAGSGCQVSRVHGARQRVPRCPGCARCQATGARVSRVHGARCACQVRVPGCGANVRCERAVRKRARTERSTPQNLIPSPRLRGQRCQGVQGAGCQVRVPGASATVRCQRAVRKRARTERSTPQNLIPSPRLRGQRCQGVQGARCQVRVPGCECYGAVPNVRCENVRGLNARRLRI